MQNAYVVWTTVALLMFNKPKFVKATSNKAHLVMEDPTDQIPHCCRQHLLFL